MARAEPNVFLSESTRVLRLGPRWCYDRPDTVIRARRYLIAQSHTRCWRCDADTRVHAIVLPAMHQTVEHGAAGHALWRHHALPCVVHYVTGLAPAVAACMRAHTAHYYMDSSTAAGAHCMNHCEACGLKLNEAGLHREPGAAFAPLDAATAAAITLVEIAQPFSGNGARTYGECFFSAMTRA